MKKILIPLLLLLAGFGCKKDENQNEDALNLTVDFNNIPVDTIKTYINGKWILDHMEGGWGGRQETPNSYFEFTFNPDSIQTTFNGSPDTKSAIEWDKVDVGFPSRSYYTIYPARYTKYILRGIFNDTLILNDYDLDDGHSYHLVRQ